MNVSKSTFGFFPTQIVQFFPTDAAFRFCYPPFEEFHTRVAGEALEVDMEIRLLFATPDQESQTLLDSLLTSALELTPLSVRAEHATTKDALLARVDADADDVVVLDWLMAQSETPALVSALLERNPKLRIVALLPQSYRQYRRQVWQAGACSSIAKENMEQEWFSSVLCIMHRAMQREAKLHAHYLGLASAHVVEESATCCVAA
jgi:DNA-binding NtrC family response regulator